MADRFKIEARGLEAIDDYVNALPKTAPRALERAIDYTAKEIKKDVKEMIPRVFDNPVAWTRNSLQVTPTRNHNMTAFVWFKEPPRMSEHYLVPQVDGGPRDTKGFERALDNIKMVPGKHLRLLKSGNVSPGLIQQVLSVLKRAERYAGATRNISGRSKRRNKAERDFIWLRQRRGKLPPGIYRRVSSTGRKVGGKIKARENLLGFATYQRGSKVKGRKQRIIRARGLQAVFVYGRQRKAYVPRLRFYHIADKTHARVFEPTFYKYLDQELAK